MLDPRGEEKNLTNNARRYLQRIGNSWYVRVKVPRKLQALFKNTHIRRALGTRDLDRANELKWAHIKAIKASFAKAARGPVPAGKLDPHTEDARKYREALIEVRAEGADDQIEVLEDFAVDYAQELERKIGDENVRATGTLSPPRRRRFCPSCSTLGSKERTTRRRPRTSIARRWETSLPSSRATGCRLM